MVWCWWELCRYKQKNIYMSTSCQKLEVTELSYRCSHGTDSIYSSVEDSVRILLKQGQEGCACISEGGT